ncbi:MAG: triose-phosphate isomerase [Deltaproteobacteria bacterium]
MRKPVIAGNWKLYNSTAEAVKLIDELIPLVSDTALTEIVVAPAFTALSAVKKALADSGIQLAAQDCFWEEEGAYTGEVSPMMLTDVGCSHVLIGHSERRQFFGETDKTVNKKLKAAIAGRLTVIFCIGETLAERESGNTFAVLRRQIAEALTGFSETESDRLIIAYEPVWAIGTGKTASEGQAQETHAFIRQLLSELYSPDMASRIRILYGGSVKADNIGGLMSQPDIDGALVGGASLKAESFAAIVRFAEFQE